MVFASRSWTFVFMTAAFGAFSCGSDSKPPAHTAGRCAEMGAKVLLWQVQQQGTDALNSRILHGDHFEFRGGWYRGGETELRTRASDPAFNGPT